ncbi:4Fe-4S dicluster domain-containing protein [Meiothermus hypogaeus]|uniref:4Fe-4S ferredoxin n=2 Tax=Meiothermus hypogaeus TaxID=884155 RepID=A0A511R1D7_9DEIN|nr:4Fe-4S dicluster domain-containing protein [Meiothermus hypogaeus]RIH77565.1 Anaerobic sulfite reductase subunit A [Meiothermus hypogaeus]GEM83097.1 4Fe-4S ferredoxin [Meiothermus hypogaeus NBRC 106114]
MQKGPFVLERSGLLQLLQALKAKGYLTLGPTVREGAIVYDQLSRLEDLPIGYTDHQEGGTYRLRRRGDEALFGYNVGPHSWKRFLHPPILRLFRARKINGGFEFEHEAEALPNYAFIGVRACELLAIRVQDQVFLGGAYQDPHYKARRERVFIVAVNCTQAGNTCFCASVQSGPKAQAGFDLALTEVLEGDRHYFVGEVGSERGAEVLGEIPHRAALPSEVAQAEAKVAQATRQMGRSLATEGLKEMLYQNLEHPRWEQVAARCLSCGNCTQVCPTCFCTSVEDHTDLSGVAERTRRWDSCFTADFSYLHGGSVRVSTKARYRQWLTHKLATWQDQFGMLGCVGCGRCITWCPVGIDLTEEVAAMRGAHV